MKKILFLLLSTIAMYGQVPADATPLENIQITNNTTDNSATKVVVQSASNVLNTISKTDLQDAFYFATASALPVVGITDKLYITRDDNKLYRFNGTIYQELTTDISGKENISNKQNSLATDGAGIKFPTVDATNAGLATKAPISSVHNPVTIGTANGLSLSTQQLSLGLASSGVTGALKGTDWNTFNNKVNGTGTNNFLTKWSGTNTVNASGAWREIGGRLNNSATDDMVSTFQNTGNLRNIGAIKKTSGSVTDYNYISQGEIGFIGRGVTGELPVLMSRNTSAIQEAMVINAIQDEDIARTAMSDMVFRTAWLNSNSITAYTSAGTAFSFQNGTNILSRIYRNGNIVFGSSSDNTVDKLQVNGSVLATGFKTASGTASQFLKANGSVDSNTYLTSASLPTVDQTIIDGSTNAVSGNAVFDDLVLKAIRNSIDFRGKDIEFFGDSYTSGSGATSTDKRWTSIVSRVLGATEINRGVAGTTLMKRTPINYMASPNMVDNVVNIPTKTASKAMLVFAYGLNDMGQTATDYNTTNFKTDYQFVLNNALSKGWLPSQILLIPAYYIGSSGYAAYATITGNAAPTEARHLSFIQATKEISDLNRTMYFDIYQDQKRNNTTLLDPDGIHPNNAGYAYIANDILQYLGADKIGTTLNTTWDLKAGFIPNNNGSVFYNSLIYDSGARIGIGTIAPQAGLHLNSLANTVDMRFTNSVTGSTNSDGTGLTVDLNADFVINNYENKGIITATNNTIRNYTNNIGQTIFGGTTASNTTDKLQVIGSATATQWIADNGTNGSFFQGKNGATNLFVIGNDNAIGGGSINDVAYYSYSGNHKFYQPVFAPTATAGTNTTQIATTAFVQANSRPYKVYTALLSQTGTNAPVATVLENTLGGTVVWSRVDTGRYLATLTGAFTGNKTVAFFQSGYSNPGAPTMYSSYKDSDNAVRLYSLSTGFYDDQILSGQIEIRVYN